MIKFQATDTSSWAIAFTLLMLAMHPEIQEKVIGELNSVMPDKTCDITRNELEQLDLLERCAKESLRLFPPVTLMARKCDAPFKLRDYDITPGMSIVVDIHRLHRKERYWGTNAHLFNPDNFLPEQVAARPPYCYIPFSAGLRDCIGNYV